MTASLSSEFDGWARKGAGPKMEDAHGPVGKKVLDRIPVRYDEAFIDLGTGNGWAARYIAQRVPTIGLCVGVDASEEFVKEARRVSAGKFPMKFIHSAIEEVPFPEASFDHAFSMEALYYAKDPLVALQSIWRVLRPGGSFHMVIDYYAENPPSARWQADIQTPMHFLPQARWVELFGQAGFQDVVAERVLDDRPVPEGMEFPWGGFHSREELVKFRTQDGSLYVRGTKKGTSRALEPYLDRAQQALSAQEPRAARGRAGRR
jgi:SAM-dependent methyltransferase